MKKSSSVTLTLLAAVAALATTGCTKKETRNCIDQNNRIIEDRYCEQQPVTGYYGGSYPYYWRYGGSSGGHIGDLVFGGSSTPTPGRTAVSGSVSRGGFGSSAGEAGS